MIRLLVIADDFTGALDAGVQLSSAGASTKVIVSSFPSEIGNIHGECEVLVIDAETRHLKPKEAWGIVHGLVDWAVQSGIHTIYKKTDSALRGNIGAELEAVLSASGEKQLIFAPAFPKLHRITKAGIHYINGLPVSESDFGKDPYEAVTSSSVSEVLAKTSTAPSFSVTTDSLLPSESGILVFDVSSDPDFKKIADALPPCNRVRLLAGCAGFATLLLTRVPLLPSIFLQCAAASIQSLKGNAHLLKPREHPAFTSTRKQFSTRNGCLETPASNL